MKILWVKSGPLFPLNTGGRRRTHSMLRELANEHEITYLALVPEEEEISKAEEEADYAQKKVWIPTFEPKEKTAKFLLDLLKNFLFSTRPYVLDRYTNKAMNDAIPDMVQHGNFDLIVCDFLTPSVNFNFHQITVPTVLFQHNMEAQIWKRLADEKSNPVSAAYFRSQFRKMEESERLLSAQFDGVITVSPEDTEHCEREYALGNVLGPVPTGVDTTFFQPPNPRDPIPGKIGFLGSMDWLPNVECAHYFTEEILPLIRKDHPNTIFSIIGRDPTPSVQKLSRLDPLIEVTGTVDDVRPYLDDCEVLVVPLRSGGGTRIKIFEAMAQGVPVVSTTIGAEGLPVEHGETILIADSPVEFAEEVKRLLESKELRETISSKARALLVSNFSWNSVCSIFVRYCKELIRPR